MEIAIQQGSLSSPNWLPEPSELRQDSKPHEFIAGTVQKLKTLPDLVQYHEKATQIEITTGELGAFLWEDM